MTVAIKYTDNGEGKLVVSYVHNKPELLSDVELSECVIVEAIPTEPDLRGVIGKGNALYYDPSTNAVNWETHDRALSELEKIFVLENQQKSYDQKYTELDKTTTDLETLRTAKINQLKELCTLAIYAGFTSTVTDANGVAYEFGFKDHDQSNFNKQTAKLNLWKNLLSDGTMTQAQYDAKFPLQWKAVNIGVIYLTEAEFIQVTDDAETHQLAQQHKYWTLEAQVLEALTNEEIDAVIW